MASPDSQRIPVVLFTNRNFLLLAAGYFISAFGDNFNDAGQLKMMDALQGEQATRLMALMMFGLFVPYIVFGPLAGFVADRFSRKWVMVVADVGRALLLFNFARLIPWLRDAGAGAYTVMYTQLTIGLLAAYFSPARQALLPQLVRNDQLVRANGLIAALAPIGAMIGFLIGGWIVDNLGAAWNFRINCGTYLLSAAFIVCILAPAPGPRPEGRTTILGPLIAGFRYVRAHRRVLDLILLGALFWGAAGVVYSCIPALVARVVAGQYTEIGMYRALTAVGMAVGAGFMTWIGPALGIRPAILGGLGLAAGWLVLLAVVYQYDLGAFLAAACLLGVGFAGTMLLVTIMASLQRFVPDSRRGRVFGLSDMATMGAMVLATGLLGLPQWPGIDRYVALILLLTAGGLVVALALAVRIFLREVRHSVVTDALWGLLAIYAKSWARLERIGPCRVPRTGPVIVAANHTSGFDGLAIIASCRHRIIGFIVEQRFFRLPLVHWFMRRGGCIEVDRARPRKSFLSAAMRRLHEGGCLGIFPHGTYSPPGAALPPAKEGVARLALRTGAVVVPCHVSGTEYDENPLFALLRRHRVQVRFGPPVDLSDLRTRPRDRDAIRAATARILSAIDALAPEPQDDAREADARSLETN